MKDNLPEDHYFYEIIVQTGPMLSHGTKSKVQMILTGEDNWTQTRTLSDPEHPHFFNKGGVDCFLMSVDKPLGALQYLRIWHDNSGIREMQPWHLSYIIVHDLQTGERCRFFADKWLAIDRDEFTSEMQLGVSLPDGECSFSYLFKQGLFKFLNDDHIFWSVFSRPIRSRFTRVQRCCVAAASFFLAMLNNAIWTNVNNYVTSPLLPLTKMLNLSGKEVGSGVISSITYVSWMVLIAFCFKKAEQGRRKKSRFDKVIEEAAQDGKVVLPEKSFSPDEPHP